MCVSTRNTRSYKTNECNDICVQKGIFVDETYPVLEADQNFQTYLGKGPFIFYQEEGAGGFCRGATRKNSDVRGGHLRKIKF